MPIEFEWDNAKSLENLRKHGIAFEEAKLVFDGPILTRIDDRADVDELREITLGALSPDAVIVVVHTDRNDRIRLISARKANRRERKIYYDHLTQANEGD